MFDSRFSADIFSFTPCLVYHHVLKDLFVVSLKTLESASNQSRALKVSVKLAFLNETRRRFLQVTQNEATIIAVIIIITVKSVTERLSLTLCL